MSAHSFESARSLEIVRSLARVLGRGWGLELELEGVGESEAPGQSVDVVVGERRLGRVRAHGRAGANDDRVRAILGEVAASVAEHVGAMGALAWAAPPSQPPRRSYGSIVGASAPMQSLYATLDKLVASESTVLISGENGTGKELVARAIHQGGRRHSVRFVIQNCSAFNENLLDSELFGHKRGSFTGAISDKPGLFEVADTGTFFLDEIGDMSPSLQVKVLRVLQEGTFTSVGDTDVKKVDVRIIAATNRDLTQMVERGSFREDLFYRINVINVVVPPLRERTGDVELLADAFLARGDGSKRLSSAAMSKLVSYPWPGNVRELENEIERAIVLAGNGTLIEADLLSPRIGDFDAGSSEPNENPRSLPEALKTLERRMIREALVRHDWNKTRAARELEVSRRNLIRLVQKYELEAQ